MRRSPAARRKKPRRRGRDRVHPARPRAAAAQRARIVSRRRWVEVFPVTPATPGLAPQAGGEEVRHERMAQARPSSDGSWYQASGAAPGTRESALGSSPDPGRDGEARHRRGAVHRLGDPARRWPGPGTAPLGTDLAAVPACPGSGILAVDFLHVDTMLCKRLYVLVFIEHGTRRMHFGGVTASPTGGWTVQQARNLALSLDQRFEDIRFLLRDRGSNFTASFDAVFQDTGATILRTAVQAPPDERGLRAPGRHSAPRSPRPDADPRRGAPARRPHGISDALQHGQAFSRASHSTSPTATVTFPAPP